MQVQNQFFLTVLDDHLVDTDKIEKMINKNKSNTSSVKWKSMQDGQDYKIVEKYDLKIIEDSCQALGAKYRNNFAGTFGSAGVFVFFQQKQ